MELGEVEQAGAVALVAGVEGATAGEGVIGLAAFRAEQDLGGGGLGYVVEVAEQKESVYVGVHSQTDPWRPDV